MATELKTTCKYCKTGELVEEFGELICKNCDKVNGQVLREQPKGYIRTAEPSKIEGTAVIYAKGGIQDYICLELLEGGFVRWRPYAEEPTD